MRHQNESMIKVRYGYEKAPLDAIWRPGTIVWKRCGRWWHFTDAPQVLEETFKGINSLKFIYG